MNYCRDGTHAFLGETIRHRQQCTCGRQIYNADARRPEPSDWLTIEQCIGELQDLVSRNTEPMTPALVAQFRELYEHVAKVDAESTR